jgi:hypothetical protein
MLLAIHPGEHLTEELKELNMSAASLARQLHVPTNRITQILNGRRDITAAWRISSAPVPNSGSICKASTICASPSRKREKPSRPFPPSSA